MRSVCELNFQAMNILDPAEQSSAQAKMEQELAKQVESAMMMGGTNGLMENGSRFPDRSEVSFNLSEANDGPAQ